MAISTLSKRLSFVLVLVFLTASVILVKPVSGASTTENSWVEKSSPMPSGYWDDEAAVVNGTIYLMGVILYYDWSTNLWDISSNNYAYNPSTGSWTTIAPMPTPRISFSIATCDNKIYVIGGFEATASNGASQVSCSVNEVYNPSTDTWTTAASMPIAAAGAQANTVNGKIYVMGGSTSITGESNSTLNITQIFDPTIGSWSTGASMPYPVASAASAVMGNNIYIIGGDTQIYDTAKGVWSLGLPTSALYPGEGAGATTGVNASKRIYVFGGVAGFMVYSNQTYAYDPVSNSWAPEAPMPDALMYLTVAVINDVFYVFGEVGIGAVVIEQYTPIGYGTPDPSYVLEHTPPNITLLSPLNQTYNDSTAPLVFTVNKPLTWASYSLDGKQNITITGNTTITNLNNGFYTLTLYANDTYGNVGSQTVNFTVEKPQTGIFVSTVIIAVIAVPVLVVCFIVGLLLFRRHRKTTNLRYLGTIFLVTVYPKVLVKKL